MANFELESLLNYREHVENQIKRDVGSVEAMLQDAREALQAILDKRDNAVTGFEKRMKLGARNSECRMHCEYMKKLKAMLGKQAEFIREKEQELHQKREELVQAVKEKKMIEKLREKRIMQAAYLAGRKETDRMDDFSAGAFIRNKEKM